MPCDGSHMAPNGFEVEMSKVMAIRDELRDEVDYVDLEAYRGYHPHVYNQGRSRDIQWRDEMVADLCSRIKQLSEDEIKAHSLELQLWWREHQKADKAREAREKDKAIRLMDEIEELRQEMARKHEELDKLLEDE